MNKLLASCLKSVVELGCFLLAFPSNLQEGSYPNMPSFSALLASTIGSPSKFLTNCNQLQLVATIVLARNHDAGT